MQINWIIDKNGIYRSDVEEGNISYPDGGNETSFELEEHGVWFKQRNDLILALIKKHEFKGDFLDIGGGNGFQAKEIINGGLDGRVALCEPGYKGCLNAKKRGVEYVFNGVFQDFPFDNYNVGAVGLFDVIEHIENDTKFLNELYPLLPNGSKVFITVPAMKMLWAEIDPLSGHYRRYNKKELKRLASSVEFKLIDSGYYFNFYVIPMFLLRVIPFRLGIRKGWDRIVKEESKNHKGNKGLISKFIDYAHKRSLKKISQKHNHLMGTSMFIVLEKMD